MKPNTIALLCMGFLAIIIPCMVFPVTRVTSAASIADNIQSNDNNTSSTSTSTSTSSSGEGASAVAVAGTNNGLVLTAVPDKPTIRPGDSQTIHFKTQTTNGTALADSMIQAIIQDWTTGKQKMLFSGQTNDKGVFDITTNLGPHTVNGQYFVGANASNNNSKSNVSTGFAVDSSSSIDSKGKCSGSSCK